MSKQLQEQRLIPRDNNRDSVAIYCLKEGQSSASFSNSFHAAKQQIEEILMAGELEGREDTQLQFQASLC